MTEPPGDAEDWRIYRGFGAPHDGLDRLPPPPSWRDFGRREDRRLGPHHLATRYRPGAEEVEMVNAALYLRRPLLVSGPPGTGKSTLASSIAYELGLGPVLHWPITSRSTVADGLYRYDAIGRLHDVNLGRARGAKAAKPEEIGRFIRLGPLGTAFLPSQRPRVLLIDEIDKGDLDLPNDLLHLFEDGQFTIPELQRLESAEPVEIYPADSDTKVGISAGVVACSAFPVVVMTSNGERDFPAAFRRRCLPLEIDPPDAKHLTAIVEAHLGQVSAEDRVRIERFADSWERGDEHAADQLLNALYVVSAGGDGPDERRRRISERLEQPLDRPGQR